MACPVFMEEDSTGLINALEGVSTKEISLSLYHIGW